MWLPEGQPIPCVGPDTRARWLVRDVPRAELEQLINAAAELGWHFEEAYVIAEAEPPVSDEMMRLWFSAEIPKTRKVRPPRVKQPSD